MNKPKNIFIHHVGYNHSFYTVNSGHKRKGYPKSELGWYIGYHWFIDSKGRLFQGRKENEDGMHNIGHNFSSVAVCLSGNLENEMATFAQLKTLRGLLPQIQKRWDMTNQDVLGHRDTDKTICPGSNMMTFIKAYKALPEDTVAPPIVIEVSKGRLQAQLDAIKKVLLALRKRIYELFKR